MLQAKVECDIIGRIVTVIILAAGVCTLLLADVFATLTALSSGFEARQSTALIVGVATVALGVVLNVMTARRRGRATVRRGGIETARGRGARPVGPAARFLIAVVAGLALGWLGFGVLVYSVQDLLVFSPRGLSPSRLERIASQYPQAEDIEIVTADGTVLRGWLLPPAVTTPGGGAAATVSTDTTPIRGATDAHTAAEHGGASQPEPVPLVIVFSGQAGEASSYFELAAWLPEMAWGFINYRGYGASDGSPSDTALFDDATAIFDYFTSRPDVDAANVFALGGSMGTGVATYLAAHRPLAGVVLFSPYDSIGAGVAQDMLPWLPTSLLFRHRFDAAAHAPSATAPVLAIVGEDDLVIRPARSQELLRHWGGSRELIAIPGGDHYSIYEDEDVWRAVQRFVRENVN